MTPLGDPAGGPPRLVSVVIAAFNSADTLGVQLEALTTQDYGGMWEVIVSDNGSTDETAALARSFSGRLPGLRVVDSSDRRGASHARNVGVQAAQGDFIATCDADDQVTDGWLAALTESARGSDIVAGVLDPGGLNSPSVRRWRNPHPQEGLPTLMGFLPFARTGNLGVWAGVVNRLGGWNEEYLAGQDVEFSWRAQLEGYRVGLARTALVRTRFRGSLRDLTRQGFSRGVAHARLYRDFKQHGLERPKILTALRQWAWLAWHVADCRSTTGCGAWLWIASTRWGRLRGSIRYRVLCL